MPRWPSLAQRAPLAPSLSELLAEFAPHILLIGKRLDRLAEVKARCVAAGAEAQVTSDLGVPPTADIVLTVTSAVEAIVQPEHLKPGAVVCDVARPRDVSKRVAAQRNDVLVIEGGFAGNTGRRGLSFDFGFPPRTSYACMAETMALALEGRYGVATRWAKRSRSRKSKRSKALPVGMASS